MKNKAFSIPFYLWLGFLVILPLGLIVYYGFTSADGGFSVENFARFADETYIKVFWRSIKIAVISTIACIFIGYPAAYILARGNLKYKNLILLLVMLPMWMNFLLRTYSWLSLLENSGLINSFLGKFGIDPVQFLYNENAVIFGTVYNFLSFMIMPIHTVLIKLDESLMEAAADLGATPVKRFFKIVLPFSLPGVLSGIAMVFVPSVTTFVISQLMGGGKVPLVGDVIEKQFRVVNDWHFGSAVSLVVMVCVLLFMYAINKGDDSDTDRQGMIL